jgi:arylsulfatase A-like enzyme
MGKHFDFVTVPPVDYPQGQYLADFLTDQAVAFIDRHRDEPFFLYVPHFGVHSPHEAKPANVDHFRDKPPAGGHQNPTYAAMIRSVDESVGRIVATLDRLRLTEKTMVVFTSDNGGVGGYVREGLKASGDITDNHPLRSGKGSLYEGGTREPFIVRWPSMVPEGKTCNVPTIHVDVFPTFLEVGAAPHPRQVLDGESLLSLFKDPSGELKRDAIFQHFPGYLGAGSGKWRTTPVSLIQAGDWKLMEFLEDGRLELYDLKNDIGESRNLALAVPEKTKQLKDRLDRWRQQVNAPMPTKNVPSAAKERPQRAQKRAAAASD